MSTLTRLHRWAVRFGAFWMAKWGERSFLILLAILIGGLAALAAGVLHLMVEWLSRGGAALISGADATTWAEYGALGAEWSTKGCGIL